MKAVFIQLFLNIKDLANQMNIETPSITFDQPLWVKAVDIVLTKKLATVVRLGGFHCLMSFLGSVGTCMKGSGLAHLFENVYGKNTVKPHNDWKDDFKDIKIKLSS